MQTQKDSPPHYSWGTIHPYPLKLQLVEKGVGGKAVALETVGLEVSDGFPAFLSASGYVSA